MATRRNRNTSLHVLAQYLVLTYAAVLVNMAAFLRDVEVSTALAAIFVGAVYLSYSLIYVLAVFLPVMGLDIVLAWGGVDAAFAKLRLRRTWIIFGLAVLGSGILQVLLFADRFIFRMYGYHLNGFVWNLVKTRGGIDSLGGGGSTTATFTLIIAAFLALQGLLLGALLAIPRLQTVFSKLFTLRRIVIGLGLIVAAGAFERVTYGVSSLRGYRPVLVASNVFPMYLPTTFTKLAQFVGMKVDREASAKLTVDSKSVRYPLEPIRRERVAAPLNIVWLVSESLRADMVDHEIMPATWAFAQKARWFRNHYSGGNGTRMAMFAMFYGLYGNFWFPFLDSHRGPVLIDVLKDAGYQMKMFTSQSFTYPEFDRTIFSALDPGLLVEGEGQPPWRRDRQNISDLLDFVDRRDPARPFMTFMFFESPHARYHFPEDTIIRRPYAEELNYATMDLQKDIGLIKNRYINACNHVDTQVQRVLQHLDAQKLLDKTIVLITGDHGEEFMEKGRWGHNSAYTEEQTRAPLVLWVPGRPHQEVTRLTSHLDIPATLMPLLGVANPPEDYCLGYDLLGDKSRDFVVISDWNTVAYVDEKCKIVFPLKAYGFSEQKMTTRDDGPIGQTASLFEEKKHHMMQIMKDMKAFSR